MSQSVAACLPGSHLSRRTGYDYAMEAAKTRFTIVESFDAWNVSNTERKTPMPPNREVFADLALNEDRVDFDLDAQPWLTDRMTFVNSVKPFWPRPPFLLDHKCPNCDYGQIEVTQVRVDAGYDGHCPRCRTLVFGTLLDLNRTPPKSGD
jgi:hypothetical protein